ncbi:MAG: FtsW/RodA/SpoVE family cell cycle protein [bacterium]
MIDRRFFRYFDWISFVLMLVIVGLGLMFVFSSTYRSEDPYSIFFKKQFFGILSGLFLYGTFCVKDVRSILRISYCMYFVVLILLAYTVLGGWIGMGAKRWISLYVIRFQPSELAKLFLPIFIASHFVAYGDEKMPSDKPVHVKKFVFPTSVLLLSFLLILKQPDLGTALIILFSGLLMMWFIGISRKILVALGIMTLLAVPVFWKFLKPYQKQRISVLFGYGDVRKERYQIEQSKIAIGSGGFTGKGFLQGTQSKLRFLPEDHTDFIFSVVCEEWGFCGALLVLLLYSLLFIRLFYVLLMIQSFFYQIVTFGLIAHLFLSVCVNIGMVVGILPIVGIPLPLFSYGLTNLWISMSSLGLLNQMSIRRFYW